MTRSYNKVIKSITKRIRVRTWVSLLLIVVLLPLIFFTLWKPGEPKAAWFNENWMYRKKLTIDPTQVSGSSDLTNFPILVSSTHTELVTYAQSDGDDIMFVDKDGNKLDHEIESYNNSTGVLVAWVRIPTLDTDVNTDFYMYYGNPSASNQENEKGVWDANYVLVQHLEEGTTAATGYRDSSRYNNHSSAVIIDGAGSNVSATGKAGPAVEFDGVDDSITIPDNDSLDFGSNSFTMEVWGNSTADALHYLAAKHAQGDTPGYGININSTTNDYRFGISDIGTTYPQNGATSVAGGYNDGAWHYVVGRRSGSAFADVSVDTTDTVTDNTITGTTSVSSTSDFTIATELSNTSGPEFDGIIDEVRVSNILRSTDWLTTTYNSINTPSTFVTVASAEAGPKLAVWLKYDEGLDNSCVGGEDACDSTTNANDGTFTGTAWQAEDQCVSGKCVFLDGSDDVTTITNATSIDFDSGLSTGLTFMGWVRVNSDGENSVGEILDKGTNTYIRVTNEGTDGLADLEAKLDLGTTDATATVTNGITLNKWHHIAVGYTDDGDDEITVYIDGISRTASTDGVGAPATTDTNNILVGGSSTANFHGFIDEFKVYQAERTAAEIKIDYLGGAVVLGASNDAIVSSGLAGYWKMDQESGNATDSSGNGSTLTDTNTVTAAYGVFANSGDFESTQSEYLYAADNAYLSLTGDITLAAWIKPESVTAATLFDIQGKWDGADESYLLAQYGDEIRMYVDSSSNYATSDSVNLVAGTWYHVAGVYNSLNQTVSIYVNGSPVAATTTGTIPSSIGDDAGRFQVGAEDSTTSAANFYDGIIDEVRLYKRMLTSGEVRQLYEWRPGPLAHWKLDENGGTAVIDSSGNGYSGTFAAAGNTPTWTTGKFGSGMRFDGTDDYFQVTSLNGKTYRAFSYSVWYKSAVTTVTDDHNIFNNFDSADNVSFGPTDDASHVDQLRYVERYNTGTNNFIYGATDVVDGSWHHLALVRTDTTIKMYIDGKEDYSGADPLAGQVITINATFESGYGPESGIDAVNGWTDDIKIYEYALTPEQVVQAMNADHPVGGSPISTAVGHWKFDEGADNTCSGGTNDVCNTGSAGTTLDGTSTATRYTSGKLNRALDFDGTDDVVTIANSNYIDFNNNLAGGFTVSAWIYVHSDGENSNGHIWGKDDALNGVDYLKVSGESGSTVDLTGKLDLGTTDASVTATAAVTLNTWTHVAMGFSDDDDDEITLWVNGVQVAQSTNGDGSLAADSSSMYIGGHGTTDRNFDGYIDEVKIYDKELTRSEIYVDSNFGAALGVSIGEDESDDLTGGAGADPIGYWKIDENTGTSTSYDSSGNGYNCTINGSMTQSDWVAGKYGSALEYDAVNDELSCTDPVSGAFDFGTTDSFSVSFWVKSTVPGDGDEALVSKGGAPGWRFRGIVDQTIFFQIRDGTVSPSATGTSTAIDGTWHHVVGVRDVATDLLYIYIDGVLEDTTVDSTTGSLANATALTIGNAADPVAGVIDEVKIWNYALNQAQVSYDYNRGKPLAHWKFDECQNTTAYDSSGNSLSGTITPGASGNTAAGRCGSGTTTEMWDDGSTGKYNGSLGFDGSNDTVNVGDQALLSFDRTTPFSISAWFNTGTTGAQTLISKQDSSSPFSGWNLQFGASSFIYFQLVNNYGTNVAIEARSTSAQTYADNTWRHIAISYTGSGVASGVSMYLDGRSVPTTATIDGLGSSSIDNAIAVHIGSRNGSAQPFSGLIDDVRIYNYAISAAQVKTIMNNDSAVRFGPSSGTP